MNRSPEAVSDIELWNAFKQGDKEAFTRFFRRYYPVLMQYGSKLCREESQLKDCIQELFIEIWQSRGNSEPKSVKAYLLSALKYKVYKIKKGPEISSDAGEHLVFDISPEDLLINSEDDRQKAIKIVDAIRQLPDRQKEIVYLKLYQQLSYEEVSTVMQINYQVARNLFYQAIKSLRKFFSGDKE